MKKTANNKEKITVLIPTMVETDYEMNLAMMCAAARQNGGELLFQHGAWKMKLIVLDD
jgi:hypothetical protein